MLDLGIDGINEVYSLTTSSRSTVNLKQFIYNFTKAKCNAYLFFLFAVIAVLVANYFLFKFFF